MWAGGVNILCFQKMILKIKSTTIDLLYVKFKKKKKKTLNLNNFNSANIYIYIYTGPLVCHRKSLKIPLLNIVGV